MATIYLHIGTEKTGSTYIQGVLEKYSSNIFFGNRGLFHDVFRYANHMELSSIVLPSKYLRNMEVPACVERFKSKLIYQLQGNEDKDFYLSSEHLSSRVTEPEEIDALLRVLKVAGHSVVVVAFVRNPKSWIVSHYNQYIKSGGVLSFCRYMDGISTDEFISRTTDPARSILAWSRSRLVDEFKVEKYERVGSKGLLQTFFELVDLSDICVENSTKRDNLNLLAWQLEFMRLVHLYFGRGAVSRFAWAVFKRFRFGRGFSAPECCKEHLDRYIQDQLVLYKVNFGIEWGWYEFS